MNQIVFIFLLLSFFFHRIRLIPLDLLFLFSSLFLLTIILFTIFTAVIEYGFIHLLCSSKTIKETQTRDHRVCTQSFWVRQKKRRETKNKNNNRLQRLILCIRAYVCVCVVWMDRKFFFCSRFPNIKYNEPVCHNAIEMCEAHTSQQSTESECIV